MAADSRGRARQHLMHPLVASRTVPRTTLDLDPSVLRELRRRGRRDGKSMGVVASELLATALAEPVQPPDGPQFRWTTGDLGLPRIDLEDKDALLNALDQRA
jgi:hypothetical protein